MEDDGLEEERRLMYVAITRARTRLYLSSPRRACCTARPATNVSSRFLDELPEEVVKRLTPRLGHANSTNAAWAPVPAKSYKAKTPSHGFPHRPVGAPPEIRPGRHRQRGRIRHRRAPADQLGKQGMKWLALEYAKLNRRLDRKTWGSQLELIGRA